MLGLIVLIGFVAILSVIIPHRQNKKTQGECYITKNGVILNRQLHVWNMLESKLENMEYVENDGNPYIQFDYSVRGKNGRNDYSARIPVPNHGLSQIEKITQDLV